MLIEVDNVEIKTLLQSFREGTQDRSDPIFREALQSLASNPELAAWFRVGQEFDTVMVEKFRDVPVRSAVKKRILRVARDAGSEARMPSNPSRRNYLSSAAWEPSLPRLQWQRRIESRLIAQPVSSGE